ncbi:hypothetical protein POWCR01_000057900 [Plasmodium ovale]|nr:hypothetical protein POWCR01_000057900 [Plasmodium ovale]
MTEALNTTHNATDATKQMRTLIIGDANTIKPNQNDETVAVGLMKKIATTAIKSVIHAKNIASLAGEALMRTYPFLAQIHCVLFTREIKCSNIVHIIQKIFVIVIIVVSSLLSISIMCASLRNIPSYRKEKLRHVSIFKHVEEMERTDHENITMVGLQIQDREIDEIKMKEVSVQEGTEKKVHEKEKDEKNLEEETEKQGENTQEKELQNNNNNNSKSNRINNDKNKRKTLSCDTLQPEGIHGMNDTCVIGYQPVPK